MTPAEVRFAADGMLQSLATWLRLLGYDCIIRPDQSGRRLLEQAVAEDRVFLTRNIHLSDNLPRTLLERGRIVGIDAERLPDQLREVVARYSLETARYVFTRCVVCNNPLCRVDASAVSGQVPEDVILRETDFWRCQFCDKTFWRGSHVKNSLERLRRWFPAQA
jgi:uncharacterized protein with PIN domain